MIYSLVIYNSETNTAYDYAPITREVTYSTTRSVSAGKLSFSFLSGQSVNVTEGAKVIFSADGMVLFVGYVFTIERERDGEYSVTAYDQLRYLKANASYSFIGKTLTDIVREIASDFQLKAGVLEDTRYVIPTLTKEDTGCLDIISYAIQVTQNNTGRTYIFFDDCGELSLREAKTLMSTTMIGEGSLLTDYKYKSDIDSDTYNQVKLVRPNKDTGKADTYVFKDESNIKRWGLLQLYEKVDENRNAAQITEQGQTMMAYYDRVLKTVSVEALGVPGIRGGSMVHFLISDIEELSGGYWLIVEKAKHEFEEGKHSMSLEAKILKA